MKRIIPIVLVLMLAFSSSCGKRYEEFYFIGRPVSAELCSATQMSYLFVIDYPEGLGDTVTCNGEFYRNAVMAYRSPRPLTDGETVYGVAYPREDYAALNCLGLFYYNLPEIVLLSVDEEPFSPEDINTETK